MSKHTVVPTLSKTIWLYTTGFIMAIGLTLMAYLSVTQEIFIGDTAILVLMGLAILQLVVQLVFFLHLGQESRPRWNLAAFFFTLLVLVVIVIGSLWIMHNLNYNMNMTPAQMDEYMIKQSDKGF